MYTSKLTTKGQATIPKKIRKFLGVSSHDLIDFDISDGKVVVKPVKNTILDFRGVFSGSKKKDSPEKVRNFVKGKIAERAAKGM